MGGLNPLQRCRFYILQSQKSGLYFCGGYYLGNRLIKYISVTCCTILKLDILVGDNNRIGMFYHRWYFRGRQNNHVKLKLRRGSSSESPFHNGKQTYTPEYWRDHLREKEKSKTPHIDTDIRTQIDSLVWLLYLEAYQTFWVTQSQLFFPIYMWFVRE